LIEELIIKKSSEIERVEKLVDKYPETAVQILRTWLSED
jgi:flagellar biosynthesis/type III secretory pathway M-ring protein FliF/YscJ